MALTAHSDPFEGPGPDPLPKGFGLGAKSALVRNGAIAPGRRLPVDSNGGVPSSPITVVHNGTAATV